MSQQLSSSGGPSTSTTATATGGNLSAPPPTAIPATSPLTGTGSHSAMAGEEDTAVLTPGGGAAGQGQGQGQGQGNIVCSGCAQSLEETSDSVVVSFGDGLWHIDW